MGSSVNTSQAVIVLGDEETIGLPDLAEKAAEQGAVIAEIHSFARGEAVSHDDLSGVEAVVCALGRAIATRVDVWVPFPLQDLGREQHVRRISLVLQRHGLNMRMGRDLDACTQDGGFSEIDFALRAEVRAVDGLDHAALAVTAARTLADEIETALRQADHPRHRPPASAPNRERRSGPAGADERLYNTREAALFFGRSVQWIHRGLRGNVFTRADGAPLEPVRTGRAGRCWFSLPLLREMALACYRRGLLAEEGLLDLLAVLARAEQE